MAVKGKTFTGSNVEAKDDAQLYNFLNISDEFGIMDGILSQVDYSLNGNIVTLQSGYIVIYGRVIEVESATQFTIPLAPPTQTEKGYLIVKIDLSQPIGSQIELTTKASLNLPNLEQDNLVAGGTVFEYPILSYNVNDTTITNVTDERNFISSKDIIDDLISIIETETTFKNGSKVKNLTIDDDPIVLGIINDTTSNIVPPIFNYDPSILDGKTGFMILTSNINGSKEKLCFSLKFDSLTPQKYIIRQSKIGIYSLSISQIQTTTYSISNGQFYCLAINGDSNNNPREWTLEFIENKTIS